MPERLNGTVSKTVVGLRPPRVRIPVPPPVVVPGKSDCVLQFFKISHYIKFYSLPGSIHTGTAILFSDTINGS